MFAVGAFIVRCDGTGRERGEPDPKSPRDLQSDAPPDRPGRVRRPGAPGLDGCRRGTRGCRSRRSPRVEGADPVRHGRTGRWPSPSSRFGQEAEAPRLWRHPPRTDVEAERPGSDWPETRPIRDRRDRRPDRRQRPVPGRDGPVRSRTAKSSRPAKPPSGSVRGMARLSRCPRRVRSLPGRPQVSQR